MQKYYIQYGDAEKKEVTKKEWIIAERAAGFRPKMASTDKGYMDVCATGGFTSGKTNGSIITENGLECPICHASVDVYYSEEHDLVECPVCNTEYEYVWNKLIGKRRGRFEHFKGGIYVLICEGQLESDPDNPDAYMTVYRSEETGKIWIRPKVIFNGNKEIPDGTGIKLIKRFRPIKKRKY